MSFTTSAHGEQAKDKSKEGQRQALRTIADGTMRSIKRGYYVLEGEKYDLQFSVERSMRGTQYFGPDLPLSSWAACQRPLNNPQTQISILEVSTLDAARMLVGDPRSSPSERSRVGVLNFASAKKPGGGFLNGAQAQEESIARSSTLYPTLTNAPAAEFYRLHKKDPKGGYYQNAMIYSPSVVVFRDDSGNWTAPITIDVLTSAAVNAGVVRSTIFGRVGGPKTEKWIEEAMKERMARILYLFEQQGTRTVVLGSFGTGVFRNKVESVARIWAELLSMRGSRFEHSFDRVVFAILGGPTYDAFVEAYQATVAKQSKTSALVPVGNVMAIE